MRLSRQVMKPERDRPGAGRESVWDYPRPPRVEPVPERVRIIFNDVEIADTCRAWRVLETSHPPVYYIPPEDLRRDLLEPSHRRSFCEWKGQASYVTLRLDSLIRCDAVFDDPRAVPRGLFLGR